MLNPISLLSMREEEEITQRVLELLLQQINKIKRYPIILNINSDKVAIRIHCAPHGDLSFKWKYSKVRDETIYDEIIGIDPKKSNLDKYLFSTVKRPDILLLWPLLTKQSDINSYEAEQKPYCVLMTSSLQHHIISLLKERTIEDLKLREFSDNIIIERRMIAFAKSIYVLVLYRF